jgi:[acyl-carrier-protein] S-malonyltransferase
MIDDGIDTFVEIGPGHTLTNMIRRISSEVRAVSAAECNVAEL